jgi:hypothetical protein
MKGWLLDMIDAFHNFREGLFGPRPRPRLLFSSAGVPSPIESATAYFSAARG